MKSIYLLFCILFFLVKGITTACCQQKPNKGDFFLRPKIGFSRGYNFSNESYPKEINLSNSGNGIHTWAGFSGANLLYLITDKLFLSGGIQYFNRKTHCAYTIDSLLYNYPFDTTPVIESKIYHHNIEFPLMFGFSTNKISLEAGFTFVALNFPVEYFRKFPEADLQESKLESGFTHDFYPGFQSHYYFGKKAISLLLGIDFRHWNIFKSKTFDLNAGFAYSFKVMK